MPFEVDGLAGADLLTCSMPFEVDEKLESGSLIWSAPLGKAGSFKFESSTSEAPIVESERCYAIYETSTAKNQEIITPKTTNKMTQERKLGEE